MENSRVSDQVTKTPGTKWLTVPCGDCNEILNNYCSVHSNDSNRYAIRVQRLQFPVRLAFAMTINKAQGRRYKCLEKIWKIFASRIDNCMWLAHALENLPIYSCTHEKEKQKILYIQKLFNKHN
jgi:hypothetical protein